MTCKYIERCYPSTLAILFADDLVQEHLADIRTHVFQLCMKDGVLEKTLLHTYYCGFYSDFEREKK